MLLTSEEVTNEPDRVLEAVTDSNVQAMTVLSSVHTASTKEEPGAPADKDATLEGPFLATFQVRDGFSSTAFSAAVIAALSSFPLS